MSIDFTAGRLEVLNDLLSNKVNEDQFCVGCVSGTLWVRSWVWAAGLWVQCGSGWGLVGKGPGLVRGHGTAGFGSGSGSGPWSGFGFGLGFGSGST